MFKRLGRWVYDTTIPQEWPLGPGRGGGFRSDGPVPAVKRYTEAQDRLSQPWTGLVFVNPPYGQVLPRWVAKCAREAVHLQIPGNGII